MENLKLKYILESLEKQVLKEEQNSQLSEIEKRILLRLQRNKPANWGSVDSKSDLNLALNSLHQKGLVVPKYELTDLGWKQKISF